MNWQAMDKEKKQLVVLGAIVAATAVYALYTFVLKPMLAGEGGERGGGLGDLEAKLVEADQLLRQRMMLQSQLESTGRLLEEAHREHLPASDNPLSWATRQIYRSARSASVQVESVEEVAQPGVNWSDAQLARSLRAYSVRIQFKGGYFNLVDLVHEIEAVNPYATLSSIAISPLTESITSHQMQIVLEWPAVINPAAFADLLLAVDAAKEVQR